jgi:hypothetical protein
MNPKPEGVLGPSSCWINSPELCRSALGCSASPAQQKRQGLTTMQIDRLPGVVIRTPFLMHTTVKNTVRKSEGERAQQFNIPGRQKQIEDFFVHGSEPFIYP